MKLRILTIAAAGVLGLSLAACQQKEEAVAPAADAPAADAMATPPADAAAPPATDPAAADTGAMSATPAPTEPEKK